MPPHIEQAGPSSRPWSFAGTGGGSSVIAAAAGFALAVGVEWPLPPFPPLPPFVGSAAAGSGGPAVSPRIAAASPALRARISAVRMPSSSCRSASP